MTFHKLIPRAMFIYFVWNCSTGEFQTVFNPSNLSISLSLSSTRSWVFIIEQLPLETTTTTTTTHVHISLMTEEKDEEGRNEREVELNITAAFSPSSSSPSLSSQRSIYISYFGLRRYYVVYIHTLYIPTSFARARSLDPLSAQYVP